MFDTTMKVFDYDFLGKQIATMFEPDLIYEFVKRVNVWFLSLHVLEL